jgi:hypothetical protein
MPVVSVCPGIFRFGEKKWIRKEDEDDKRSLLVCETVDIPGQDLSIPDLPNSSKVQFRPRFNRLQGTNDRDSKFRVYFR